MNKENLMQFITCPLTKLIFCDPVVAEDGQIYESMAIKSHLDKSNVSPVTGEKIGSYVLPAKRVRELVDEFLRENEQYRNEQFLFKKPFFLFKREFLTALKNKEFSMLKEYTGIMLNTEVNKSKETLFEIICRLCPDDVIKYIIDNSIDYDIYDTRTLKPLHVACKFASVNIIQYLVDKKVDILSPDMCGETPLGYLIMYKYTTNEFTLLVKQLLELGASVNSQNQSGLSPAHYAISKGKLELLLLFMDYGLRLDKISVPLGNANLVHYAFKESPSYDLIKYLIDSDQYLNVDIKPDTPSEQLIYQNKNLSKQQKQELVLHYLNKLVNRAVVIDNFIDSVKKEEDYKIESSFIKETIIIK